MPIEKNWRTSSQQYGSHYLRAASQPKPSKIGKTTLDYLKTTQQGAYVSEQQNIAQRFRHGLFSQPMGLSNGDVYLDYKPQQPSKKVEINQRMQQKVGPQLFSKPVSTNIGDPYKDQFRAKQLYDKQKTDMNVHGSAFLAGGKQKFVKHSEFQYNKPYEDKTYNTRDQNGNVKTGKRQVMTGNMKKGFGNTTVGHLFSAYPYVNSEYDNAKNMQSRERMEHKARITSPFVGSSYPADKFTPDYVAHQPSQPFQQKNEDQTFRSKTLNNWKHNNPNKKGYNGTFTKFPQYIEEGEKPKKSIVEQKPWIPNFNGTSKQFNQTLSKPCPAPSQLTLNQIRRNKA